MDIIRKLLAGGGAAVLAAGALVATAPAASANTCVIENVGPCGHVQNLSQSNRSVRVECDYGVPASAVYARPGTEASCKDDDSIIVPRTGVLWYRIGRTPIYPPKGSRVKVSSISTAQVYTHS